MSTVGKLAGKTLFGEVTWALRSGSRPVMQRFNVALEDRHDLLYGGLSPVTLELSSEGTLQRFENLYIVQEVPSESPKWASVMVADRRYFWGFTHIRGLFNVRRRIGVKRLQLGKVAPEAQIRVPRLQYAPFSINGENRWKASEILERVLNDVAAFEGKNGGTAFAPVIPTVVDKAVDVENLELDALAADAVEQLLAFMPGASITVDPDGAVRVYDRSGGAEAGEIARLQAEIVGGGHIQPCDLSRVRPREIHVYFSCEIEVRYDSEELAHISSTSAISSDSRFMENVLDSPDFSNSSVPGVAGSVDAGTWLTFPEALRSWGTAPQMGGPLDFPAIRKAFVPHLDLWAKIAQAGKTVPAVDWSGRLAKVQQHYRQTFRINRRWIDRIFSIRPYRVALINPATGTRAPIGVWADYSYLPTQRSLIAEHATGESDGSFVVNVAAYPSNGQLNSATTTAAAIVSIVDGDQGILRLDYVSDRLRMYEGALPSQVELDGDNVQPGNQSLRSGPSSYLGTNARGIAFNALRPGDKYPTLTASHKVAVVVTCVPGSPNSKASLFKVVIHPNDVAAFPGQGSCVGPILEYRVSAGLETAKVAWSDDDAALIEQAFGIPDVKDSSPIPDRLVVNRGASGQNQDQLGGASLDRIAKAAAARIWHALRDRPQGSATSFFAPAARIDGWLDEVLHKIDGTTGVVTTALSLPPKLDALRLESYLDASTRRIIMRIVDPEK